jgi:hypothetical protein
MYFILAAQSLPVEECDATGDAISNTALNKIFID